MSVPHRGTLPKGKIRRRWNKIDTQEERENYSLLMSIVEPLFLANRDHKRLDRSTLRRKAKVNIQ